MTSVQPDRRLRAASAVLLVHVVVEALWTVRLVAVVDDGSEPLAAGVGAVSTVALAVLAWLVWHGRARTAAGLVEVVFAGGSVDWLVVFPDLRLETAATMVVAAVALVLLAEPSGRSSEPRRLSGGGHRHR